MISVCMATYNGEKYIKEQIDSILMQLSDNDELIISDDGSSDETVSIILDINDKRIKLLQNTSAKENLSNIQIVTRNFENALRHAQGDFIFMSDQDDVWLPQKVAMMLDVLKDVDYVVSDCYIVDEKLNIVHNSRFYEGGGLTKNKWKALISPTPYQGSCAAFRRTVLEKALPFPRGIQSHDRWIGYVASFFFTYVILDQPLIYYRRHSNVVSTAALSNSREATLNKVKVRIKYIVELIKLFLKNG